MKISILILFSEIDIEGTILKAEKKNRKMLAVTRWTNYFQNLYIFHTVLLIFGFGLIHLTRIIFLINPTCSMNSCVRRKKNWKFFKLRLSWITLIVDYRIACLLLKHVVIVSLIFIFLCCFIVLHEPSFQ